MSLIYSIITDFFAWLNHLIYHWFHLMANWIANQPIGDVSPNFLIFYPLVFLPVIIYGLWVASERFITWLIFGLLLSVMPLFLVALIYWRPDMPAAEKSVPESSAGPTTPAHSWKLKGALCGASPLEVEEIEQAQKLLGVRADGCIGKNTISATETFQWRRKLEPNGWLDRPTLSLLTTGGARPPSAGGGESKPPPVGSDTYFKALINEELLAVAFTLSGAAGVEAITSASTRFSKRRKLGTGGVTILSAFVTIGLYLIFKTHSYHVPEDLVRGLELISFLLTTLLAVYSEILAETL